MLNEIEKQVRNRFLDRIDDRSWDEEEPRLDFGTAALPYFIDAFGEESDPFRRWRLIRVIWQFRDPAALPTLSVAVRDSSAEVWKESLDGFVTIGGSAVLILLREAQFDSMAYKDAAERIDWITEAIQQIEQHLGELKGSG